MSRTLNIAPRTLWRPALRAIALALLLPVIAFAQTTVRELVPSSAPVGARVLITGQGLADPALTVSFAPSANALVVARNNSFLEVVVPANAVTGNVRITSGATVVRQLPFTVADAPRYTVSTLAKNQLKHPWGAAAVLPQGTIAVADELNHRIVTITPAGTVSSLAGDGKQGFKNGKGTAASFKSPRGIAFDPIRRVLYVADTGNSAIREVALDGTVKTLAGDGKQGYKNGTGSAAQFRDPHGLTVGADGAIYVADAKNYRIRKVTTAGVTTSFAGTGAKGDGPVDGPLASATFHEPLGIVAHGNDFYVADTKNNAIRKISEGQVTTVIASPRTGDGDDDDGDDECAGDDRSHDVRDSHVRPGDHDDADDCEQASVLKRPTGIGVDEAGNLIVSDSHNDRIRRITLSVTPPLMTTIAGTGKNGDNDGPGSVAQFKDPVGLTVAGAIYVADEDNDAIRRLCARLDVTGFFSTTGTLTAGTKVRVLGTGFVPGGTVVKIGDTPSPEVEWISSTELSVKLPQSVTGSSITFTASACGGNTAPVTFPLDGTPPPPVDSVPPVIAITNGGAPLADNSSFRVPVVPVITATDAVDPAPVVTATLNGLPFVSGTTVSADGQYVLVAQARDASGNTATKTVRFFIDATPPAVTVLEGTTPFPAGQVFRRAVFIDLAIVDISTTTRDVRIDGAPYILRQPFAVAGSHTLTVRVTDALGNETVIPPIPFSIVIDGSGPVITFTSHAEGAVVSTPEVIVGGGSDDAVSVTVNGAPATVDPALHTFVSGTLTLVEGRNTITAIGTDSAGNIGTAVLHLELDTRAPNLVITTPAAGACVDGATVTVSGTVNDPRIESVKVNGVPATIAGGEWTTTVTVNEGLQLLTIVTADTLGNLTTVTRSVLVDRTAPEIEVRESGAPFTSTLLSRGVTPLVRAIDADSKVQLTATLDGAPYVSGTPIDTEGAHTLAVTATDCAGHQTTRSFAFTIDRTPPSIINLNPANASTVGVLPTSIAGTTDDDTATVALLGTELSAASTPAFTLNGMSFAEGVNRFTLRATDRAGNSAQLDYTVTVKTGAPIVTIFESGSPLEPNSLFTRAVTPEIRVDDAAATLSATLNDAPYTSGTAISADGNYRLKATATNSLNHTGTAEAVFSIDRTAPSVQITFPPSGSVSAQEVEVRGIATNAVSADVNGKAVTLDANGAFVLPSLYLEFGPTRIIATARDFAGNTGIAEVEVTRNDIRPGILLTYPPDRAVTNRPVTEVLGRILSPNPDGVVTIGTQTTPVDPLGAFHLSGYPLVEGDNTITVSTKTNNGGTNSASVVVTADFTPPALAILESSQPLNDGARFATEAVLSLQASDNRGGVTTEITVDGVKVPDLPHSVTATGGHIAVAVARDQAGNETHVERTFFVGTTGGGAATCTLSDFDPANNAVVLSSSTTLLGRTTSAGVKANDVAASVADGSFRATVELPQEGANTVTLRCTDGAGAAFGDPVTITLNRVTGDPSIEITAPAEGFVTADETITVTGNVGPGVTTADVNGAAAVITGSDASVARPFTVAGVRLAGGLNILAARGRNAAGRVATASRRVTALRNEPAIAISSPFSGAITGAPKIELAGTFADLDPATIVVTNVTSGATASVQTTKLSDTTGTYVAAEVSLVAGEQTLRVTGRDQANRPATASVTVRLTAGAPSVAITSPVNNAYFGSGAGNTFTVSGMFAAAPGSTVDVGGTAATVNGSSFTATAPFTAIGNNTTVVARVTEPAGASAIDTVTVTRLATAPKVLETFPAPNAVEVDAGAAMLVLFSAPMDRASLANGAFRLEDPNGATVTGTLYLDDDVLTFAPAALLTPGARYTLRVTTAAKDLAGTSLDSEWTAAFTIGTSAPPTPPTLTPVSEAFCGQTVEIRGTASAGARVQLSSGTLALTAVADAQGNFTFTLPLSGQSGYAVVRVRIAGSDGSLSPAAELTFRVDCVGPQVLNATYDRGGANRLTIDFSEPVDIPAGAVYVTLTDGRTVAVNGDIPAEDLTARTFTLNVTTAVRDTFGNPLAVPYTQTFTLGDEQPTPGDGSGFISGEIYDATTGRPLTAATITVEIPANGPLASSPADVAASRAATPGGRAAVSRVPGRRDASRSAAGTAAVPATNTFTATTDSRGRYLVRLPEGAHTIRASKTGYTSVWRQIIVPAGAGVVPIDIRLTRQGDTGGETAITRPVTLTGATATLTAIGAQALPGLLPLGWSPLTAAEVTGNFTTATLTFTVPATSRNLTAVRYDEVRDEWKVLQSVVTIAGDQVNLPITAQGAYALVYPDTPPTLIGPVLTSLAEPAPTAPLVSRAFTLAPPVVLPNGRTVATLEVEGDFPSGTAVQAYIDEELRLADGSRLLDPPFATDLLLYRNLTGALGIADFHLAPSPRAAQVILEVGYDHIRVVPYPGRLDRGTLIGSEGGLIPGDDQIAVDIPAGATPEPLRASAVSLTQQDLDAIGAIQGFQIVGGFTLTLQRATQAPPIDLNNDGIPDTETPAPELFKPARATFTLSTQHSALSTQLILVELLDQTPYGQLTRLANQIERLDQRAITKTIDRSTLPLDGITHEGRYLLLAAQNPIAFATGVVHINNSLLAGSRITATGLGVADLTRTGGIYNIPVPAAPAAPFTLIPRHTNTGNGAPYSHASAPAADAIVRVDLTLVPQPPTLGSVTVTAGNPPAQVPLGSASVTDVSLSTGVRATFTPAIDPASVNDASITVLDADTGIAVDGKATADGSVAVNWALTPGTTLQAGHRYTVVVSSAIKAPNGAQLPDGASYSFTTAAVILNSEVRAERISITIPNENGLSRVTGSAGALPANWQAVAVRRGRDFVVRYQATAAADGSFTFLAGNGGDPLDRVTLSDLIDLRVVNNAGNLAAIIPLTPFVTEDRRGFVVPAGGAARFVTVDGITIDVAEGTFDEATLVSAAPAVKQVFDDIPSLDHDVNYATSIRLDFEGRAKKPIELEIPVPAGLDTAGRDFILSLKGQSVRGPRLFAVDTLRVAGGKFTTALDPSPNAKRIAVESRPGGVAVNEILTGNDLKNYLMRTERSGDYIVHDFHGAAPGWAAMSGITGSHNIFLSILQAFFVPHYYMVERATVIVPVLQGVAFTVTGVDSTTGMQSFVKAYDPLPLGDAFVSALSPPQNNKGGPYPVYASPARVDLIDLNVANVDIRTARNFVLRLSNNLVTLAPSNEPLPPRTRVQMLNVTDGGFIAGTSGAGLVLFAERGDRIVLLVEEHDVDPNTPMTIVFNEPISLIGTTEKAIDEELKSQIKLLKALLPPVVAPPAVPPAPQFTDVSALALFTADSGGRRITITLPSSLQREALYRVQLNRIIADRGGPSGGPGMTLGQGALILSNGNVTGIGGNNDLNLDFRVRKPGGTLGTFDLPGGAARSLALNGNVLLVAAAGAGILAYDTADPASLTGNVAPMATAPANGNDFWAMASDHHGRIYSTSLGQAMGWLRSYRLEDFVAGGTNCCTIAGSALTNWRPGYSANLGLGSNTMLSDRPESFPRQIKLALQDVEKAYLDRQQFVAGTHATVVQTYPNGMVQLEVSFTPDPANPYRMQRITVENQTLDMSWSADTRDFQPAVIRNILAGPHDQLRVIRNRTTYGVISHLGYGIGMYDLNAIESNHLANAPAGYARMAEQITLTHGSNPDGCLPAPPQVLVPEPIRDISLSSDTTIHPEEGTSNLIVYAPDPYHGLLDLRFKTGETSINNDTNCGQRGKQGLVFRPTDSAQEYPRIAALRQAFRVASGHEPYPHFFSVANFSWRLNAQENKGGERQSKANQAVRRDYVLVAGGDFGLLVVEVGGDPKATPNASIPYFPLDKAHLADIIWIPDGALAVRTIPRTTLAVVVSRAGRVHLVDLAHIDEREGIGVNALFPTVKAALDGQSPFPEGVGASDPRIIWSSEARLVQGVLSPVVDPDTGMLYAGQMVSTIMKAVAAIDPRIRMKVDLGKEQLSEVSGVVPHGIDPPTRILDDIRNLPPCTGATPHCRENASLGAFRLEVSLPGAIAQLLTAANNELQVAVESERVIGGIAEQTPPGFPRSHLRRARRDGSPEDVLRAAPNFRLERLVPNDAALERALRHQRGFNRFVSPWIVAIADPRASSKYVWPTGTTAQQKADAGCRSCNRPKSLENLSEADGVYELWTNGRLIAVRPEIVAAGRNIFAGTPYAYLGEENRLVARFPTIMADTVRANDVRVAGQNPPVADGAIQDTVYLHSGEMQTATTDLNSGGRNGFDVIFDRTYRSRTLGGTVLGQGWESSNFRRLRELPNRDVELRDSSGEIWLFPFDPNIPGYLSPKGFFMRLMRSERGWILLDQRWRGTAFDELGRLMFETDEFSEDIAVAAGTNKGNAVHYLYDDTGRLARIVDPVERASELTYWQASDAGTPGAYPGLLRGVKDWRERTTQYEYDSLGRLITVRMPEVQAGTGVPPDFTFAGASRPRTEYGYQAVTLPPVPAAPSQLFNDYVDFLGNLLTVKEPDQVAATAGVARVSAAYDDTTGYVRDRLLTQTWGTGETVRFTHADATNVSSVDAYGQQRGYTLTPITAHDKRAHIADMRVSAVATIEPSSVNSPANVGLQHSSADLTVKLTYNDEGLHDSVEYANGLKVVNTWKYASDPATANRAMSIAPGMLLEHASTTGPHLPAPIDTDIRYDKTTPTAFATQLSIGRGSGGAATYRDAQSPSRDRKLVSSQEEGFVFETDYNDFGLPTSVRKKQGTFVRHETKTDYYPPDATPEIARSRPKTIVSDPSRVDISQSFTYSTITGIAGGEKIEIKDDKRGVTTETWLDTHGRKTHIVVTGANQTVLTKESFGYDAAGRLAYLSREQNGVGNVETRIAYDAMGREISKSLTGAAVNGAPVTLTQTTAHDYPGRKMTETGPFTGGSGSNAPTTVTTVDGLGRPMRVESTGTTGETLRTISGYDRSGSASYESDGVRNATLTLNDARGRQVDAVTADGIRTQTTWGPWDEPVDITGRDSDNSVIGQTRNFFTDFGRLRSTNEAVDAGGRARTTYQTWNDADTDRGTRMGAVASLSATQPSGSVRVQHQYFDAAGRLERTIYGASTGNSGAPSGANLFDEALFDYSSGGSVPGKVTYKEPLAGVSSATTAVFDGLERPIEVQVEGASDSTKTTYDEAGNALTFDAQGMAVASATYDSRGLLTSSTQPGGGTMSYTYDALGSMREYKDEDGVLTRYTTDGLGRVTKVDYPDGTSEETKYEADTGMVVATRNRAGQWLAYSYGPGGRLLSVHTGPNPTDPFLIEYKYDAAGRLELIRNKDAAIAYDGYDLLGRPTTTRAYRYANSSGFTGTPVLLDVHTQKHTWSVFDGERDSWRMPAAGATLDPDNPASPWLQTIIEARDAGSNLIQQAAGGVPITKAEGRASGKLKHRERAVGTTWLKTDYAYSGDDGQGTKSFLMAKAASTVAGTGTGAGTIVAGSQNARDAADRLASSIDLALGNRVSTWLYDARGRLERSWLNVDAAGPRPPTKDGITTADFREKRDIPAFLSQPQHQALGATAAQIEPLSWTATKNDANQLLRRDSTLDGQVQDARVYTFTGGRRTQDGAWESQFDELGRLLSVTNTAIGRRIEYKWGPSDRIVGRAALKPDIGGGWSTEDRGAVLQADGLPARTTFVWDPIADRLLAIYEEGRSTADTPVAPEAGLLRQYLHGDQGFDDPVRVLALDNAGVVRTYLPIIDEAGAGSLQSVLDANTGNVVERVLYADAYGEGPRYLQGAVVDSIDLEAKKNDTNQLEKVTVRVHLTEAIEAASLAGGVRLGAIDAARTMVYTTQAVPRLYDDYTVEWELDANEWATLSAAGVALEVAVRDTLRFTRWGDTPASSAPSWAAQVYGVVAEAGAPVIARQSFSTLTAFLATIPARQAKATNVYGMTDLYLAASRESKARLFTGFKAAPFIEPATSLVYLRARWYDPATGAFLTPDPSGYADSSNLYAGFDSDPVNNTDPSGELVESVWDAASLGIGLYSISQWDENTSFWEKTLDLVGVGLDGAALALPLVPGGVGAALKAYRGANVAFDAANAGRKAARVLDAGQAIEQTASAMQAGTHLYDDYTHNRLGAGSALAMVQVGLGLRQLAKAALPKHTPHAADTPNAGPCPFRPTPACVAAGTPISTPDGHAVSIETLRVGDRVAATHVTDIPEDSLTFDSREWHLLKLRMSNPADPGDTYEVQTLRPLAWIVAHEAWPGRTITFETERNKEDQATVLALERMPEIAPGPGRVVLSTFTHRDQLLRLRFEGEEEPLEATPSHRIYSVEQDTWVPASELKVGDQVRTRDGKAVIASIEQQEVARVFDLEVESDHSYFVDGADVLVHNCADKAKKISKKRLVKPVSEDAAGRRPKFWIKTKVDAFATLAVDAHTGNRICPACQLAVITGKGPRDIKKGDPKVDYAYDHVGLAWVAIQEKARTEGWTRAKVKEVYQEEIRAICVPCNSKLGSALGAERIAARNKPWPTWFRTTITASWGNP